MPSEVIEHSHCLSCYDSKCSTRLLSCNVVPCELECGAHYHACKRDEHSLLCSNRKVPCINAGYGCPLEVQRSQMCRHLGLCPASLVHCTMEWNRWPVCSSERQSHQPVQIMLDFNSEQLDIALALRDQRMLTKSMRASMRTRKILTNNLNRRHPAVPLATQLTNKDSSQEFDEHRELQNLLQDMHQWENTSEKKRSRSPAGLRQSICEELYRASEETAQQLSSAIDVMTGTSTSAPSPRRDFSLGSTQYPYIHCAHCERRKERLERLMDSHNAMRGTDDGSPPHETVTDVTNNGKLIASHGGDPAKHAHEFLQVSGDALLTDLKDEQAQKEYHSSSSSLSEGSLTELSMPALFVTPSTTGEVSSAPGRGHSKILVIEPPKMTGGSASFPGRGSDSSPQTSLSLDLSLESITKYQAKPDSMYTFLCAQVFRRDEFASHFQNVHSDIHGGLSGWLEQRCPLAPYGCTYSQRRFYPGKKAARIIHSQLLESFGVQEDSRSDDSRSQPQESHLADHPLVELEWVHVGKSSSNSQREEISTEIADDVKTLNETDSELVEFTHGNGHSDELDSKRAKMDKNDDSISDIQTDKSKVAIHKVDQSESTSHKNDSYTKLNVETANLNTTPDDGGCTSLTTENSSGSTLVVCGKPSAPDVEVDHLSRLPTELLCYLIKFLDGFSLCNLSLTSKLLRQVCCSILEERGMVTQHWEKQSDGRWQVAYKVWQFSTAFSPVRHWGFEDHPSLAVHLSKCPYNVKRQHTDPVQVMVKDPKSLSGGTCGRRGQESTDMGVEPRAASGEESNGHVDDTLRTLHDFYSSLRSQRGK